MTAHAQLKKPTKAHALAVLTGFFRRERQDIGEVTGKGKPLPNEPHPHTYWHTVGHFLADELGAALRRHKITPTQWQAFYDAALQGKTIHGSRDAGTATGWISPLQIPTVVTSRFGAKEEFREAPHTGVDLRAPEKSVVVAPIDLKVTAVGKTSDGNLVVRAVARRPDGNFPSEHGSLNGTDDSGYRLEFDHLSIVGPGVGEGVVVPQGHVLALSGGVVGAEGAGSHTTGAHLHFAVEWVQEGTLLNKRVFVDPTVLVSADALKNPGKPSFVPSDAVGKAVLIDKGGTLVQREASAQSVRVVLHNSGVVQIGANNLSTGNVSGVQGNPSAVPPDIARMFGVSNSGTAQFGSNNLSVGGEGTAYDDVNALFSAASDGEGAGAELMEDTELIPVVPLAPPDTGHHPFGVDSFFRGKTPQLPHVLQGVGDLAGKTYRYVTSPQGLSLLTQVAGGAAQVAGLAAGAFGALSPILAPLATLIPYVGEVLGPLIAAAGPVAAISAPVLGGLGAAATGAGRTGLAARSAEEVKGFGRSFSNALSKFGPGAFVDMQGNPVPEDMQHLFEPPQVKPFLPPDDNAPLPIQPIE